MIDELNKAINDYQTKWQGLVAGRHDKAFFDKLKPTAVAWKVENLADFEQRFAELRDQCDQIHLGWVNERWLGTLHLKKSDLPWGVELVKLMQRRPGSSDAVGLDHLDFLVPPGSNTKSTLEAEPDLKWTEETNGRNCRWLSLWFVAAEAKLRTDTVLQVCADELLDQQGALTREA